MYDSTDGISWSEEVHQNRGEDLDDEVRLRFVTPSESTGNRICNKRITKYSEMSE